MNEPPDIPYLHALARALRANPEPVVRLRSVFSAYRAAWEASRNELAAASDEKTANAISALRETIRPELAYQELTKHGVSLISSEDPIFPPLLREIAVPPQWLYIKGRLPAQEEWSTPEKTALAVVGSRKATSYGREATDRIVRGLAEQTRCTIVSGCAVGIDGQAHQSALKYGLPTIAIIGSGLDAPSFYPPNHIRLADDIVSKGGAVISEYPPETPAFKHHFIARNRIVSGIAKGTLVVEAQEKSGALITARFALEQGRSVMAVPGSIFSSYSHGTHALIAEGARLVSNAQDIMDELDIPLKNATGHRDTANLTEEESTVIRALETPLTVDALVKILKVSTPDIISLLSMLELKAHVKETGNGQWMKI